jgi:hypothetical protein
MIDTRADLEELVEAERLERPPPALARSGWDRLSSAIAQAAAPLDVAIAPLRVPSNALAAKLLSAKAFAAKAVAAKSFFAMVLVGAATAGVGYGTWIAGARLVGAPPSKTTPASRSASVAHPRASVLPAAPAAWVDRPSEKPPAPTLAPGAKHPGSTATSASKEQQPPPPSDAPSASTFDAELSLLRRAKTELDQGRPHLAQVWLGEHAERFHDGVFAAEREALRVLVRCLEHPDGNAALAGAEFLRAHPESPVSARIRRACRTQDDFGK